MKTGKNDPRCGVPCDTLLCSKNRQRPAMRDLGALSPGSDKEVVVFFLGGGIVYVRLDVQGSQRINWRVPNPPLASHLVAEKPSVGVSTGVDEGVGGTWEMTASWAIPG